MVVEDLGAGAARAGIAHLPEVIGGKGGAFVVTDAHDALDRHTDLIGPDVESFVVRFIDGYQQALFGQLEGTGQEFPGKTDGVLLEVVTEAEVAQHLEEGVVTSGIADVFQVIVLAASPYTALGRGCTVVATLVCAKEHVLELVHPCVGEQQGRIVVRHQRAGGDNLVPLGAEILEKRCA
ncbi:hypothetical protein D3C79_463910 [compost metagenome]